MHNFVIPPGLLVAGCDEAGRGCLAGPVLAAAVILPQGFSHPLIKDSKSLTHAKRMKAREIVLEVAVAWSVQAIEPAEIDMLNILKASITAMHRALDQLSPPPEYILVDGNRFIPYKNLPFRCIIKGDSLVPAISAASILAKTARDEYMTVLAREFPAYRWHKNKGYPTREHLEALLSKGPSPHHRLSFHPAFQGLLSFPSEKRA
ncbi:MAG TPA: ribonuclease HII [Bacteroidales bacterium]|nr:ribonuclease HII [Bacteroidales bacterium]HSA43511.1 ribonuclease HII [Bacteroidales bacterium]